MRSYQLLQVTDRGGLSCAAIFRSVRKRPA
jgi:hypothetical protein